MIKLSFLGDIMCLKAQNDAVMKKHGEYRYDGYLSGLAPLLKDSNYVIANLESPIMRSPYTQDNITQSLEFKTSGEGKSIEKYISDDVSPAAITNSKNQVFLERVLEKVHKAKEVADIVVAYPHVGGQYNPSPGFYTRFIIDSLKEAGADIIVANHPHTSLRCERLDNGVFCAYALGNLAFTPDVGFFLDNVLAEFGIVLHSYWDESTKRLIKLTFNVTRCMIGEDGITRVVEVSELYNRLTNKSERERLMIDNESVVNRFAGWAKSFEPYKEYVIF